MKLNNNKKENILKAIALFNRPEYKSQAVSESTNKIEISWIERVKANKALEGLEYTINRDSYAEFLDGITEQAKEFSQVWEVCKSIQKRRQRIIKRFSRQTSHRGKFDKLEVLKEAGIQHYERYESIANLSEKVELPMMGKSKLLEVSKEAGIQL